MSDDSIFTGFDDEPGPMRCEVIPKYQFGVVTLPAEGGPIFVGLSIKHPDDEVPRVYPATPFEARAFAHEISTRAELVEGLNLLRTDAKKEKP